MGTFASRVAVLAGTSAAQAAEVVRRKALAVAASHLEAAPADLVLDDGRIGVRGAPGRGLTLAEVATIASTPRPGYAMPSGLDPGLEAAAYVPVPQSTYSSGAHAAVIEVDPETGAVRILRSVAVDDCGTIINPILVEGQVHGGIAHGIGNALLEEVVYDAAGQLATGTLMDYALPPTMYPGSRSTTSSRRPPQPARRQGRGRGRHTAGAGRHRQRDRGRAQPAPLGVAVTEMPLTPARLWQCVRAARARG